VPTCATRSPQPDGRDLVPDAQVSGPVRRGTARCRSRAAAIANAGSPAGSSQPTGDVTQFQHSRLDSSATV
jgi:hypothetical protein